MRMHSTAAHLQVDAQRRQADVPVLRQHNLH